MFTGKWARVTRLYLAKKVPPLGRDSPLGVSFFITPWVFFFLSRLVIFCFFNFFNQFFNLFNTFLIHYLTIWISHPNIGTFVSFDGKVILLLPLSSKVTVKLNRSDTFFIVNAKPKCDEFLWYSESVNIACDLFDSSFTKFQFFISQTYTKPKVLYVLELNRA